MKNESILKIEVNCENQLLIYPKYSKFPMIYRAANGINWNSNKNALISSVPREWNHSVWFKHIVNFIASEYEIKLNLINETDWINIPNDIKKEIATAEKTNPDNL